MNRNRAANRRIGSAAVLLLGSFALIQTTAATAQIPDAHSTVTRRSLAAASVKSGRHPLRRPKRALQSSFVSIPPDTSASGQTNAGAQASSPAAPLPPGPYSLPSGAVTVSTSAQLAAALAAGAPNVVLTDGTYGSSAPFSDAGGTGLYAQHHGGAVLTTGLVVGGNFGSGGTVVQGLSFDVSDPGKAFQGGEIDIWGPQGAGTQVLDCTFEGHGVVPVGLLALEPDGLVAQRLTFSHFSDEGIRASDNIAVPYGHDTPEIDSISDISVDGVSRSTPGASNGTAESGLWIGEPVKNGVDRIRIRNASISGIEVVNNSWDTTFSDLDIDMSGPDESAGVGIYLEHFAMHDVFTNLEIVGANTGINAEWNDGTPGNAASHGTTIENGTIDAVGASGKGNHAGVYLDEGTDSTTISNIAFRNQNWAGIGEYKNVGTNDFGTGNTYNLGAGAVPTSPNHI